jgi:hypothetical protein
MASINRSEIAHIANALFDKALDYIDPGTSGNRWLVFARSVFATHQEAHISREEAIEILDSYLAQMDGEIARDEGLVSVAMARRTIAAVREMIVTIDN